MDSPCLVENQPQFFRNIETDTSQAAPRSGSLRESYKSDNLSANCARRQRDKKAPKAQRQTAAKPKNVLQVGKCFASLSAIVIQTPGCFACYSHHVYDLRPSFDYWIRLTPVIASCILGCSCNKCRENCGPMPTLPVPRHQTHKEHWHGKTIYIVQTHQKTSDK